MDKNTVIRYIRGVISIYAHGYEKGWSDKGTTSECYMIYTTGIDYVGKQK